MWNDIRIGPLTLHMYGIMIALGFLAALLMCLKRCEKAGLSKDRVWGIFYCAIIGGLVGCKLLYIIVDLPNIIQDPSRLLNFTEGLVVYGGIIGGILLSYVYLRVKKEAFFPYFDLVMPAVAMAQGFGRLGCFFAGCCYGRETESAFHITFSSSDFAPNGVPLIPTQLLSSAGDFLISLLLIFYSGRKHETGRVGALYLVLYGIGRFVIEFFRGDPRGSVGSLSTSQIISLFMILAGILLFFLIPRLKRAEAAV